MTVKNEKGQDHPDEIEIVAFAGAAFFERFHLVNVWLDA